MLIGFIKSVQKIRVFRKISDILTSFSGKGKGVMFLCIACEYQKNRSESSVCVFNINSSTCGLRAAGILRHLILMKQRSSLYLPVQGASLYNAHAVGWYKNLRLKKKKRRETIFRSWKVEERFPIKSYLAGNPCGHPFLNYDLKNKNNKHLKNYICIAG